MIRPLACAALTLICCVTAAPAWAQSLGDVARKEAERRATAKKAVKSFSNADLNPSEISNPSAAPATTEAAANSTADNQAKPATGSPATETNAAATAKEQPAAPKDQKESEWRTNADALRHSIEQAQTEYAKLAATAADTSRSPGERASTARLVAQQARAVERLERRWEQFEKQAEELKVPREWLAPRPVFGPRIPR